MLFRKSNHFKGIIMKYTKSNICSQVNPVANSVLNFIEDAKRTAEMESLKIQIAQSESNFGAEFSEHVADVRKHMELTKKFVASVIDGIHKNAILQGPPGLGKSHVVVQALKDAGKVERQDYVVVKGHVTPGQLFVLLCMFRNEGQVIVLDDCDDVFDTELGFNMLKAALDPDNRTVSFQSQRVPVINGVAVGDFEFNGTLIICTNVAMTGNKMSRRGQHMAAILSRAVKWPLAWDTPQQKFAQIYNMVVNEDYLSREERTRITDTQKTDLLKLIWANLSEIRDLDLRLPQKIAAEIKTNKDWIDTCKVFMAI
jgi:Cdc6-like AAA superfamily ATPase